jgi:hypothetical protein
LTARLLTRAIALCKIPKELKTAPLLKKQLSTQMSKQFLLASTAIVFLSAIANSSGVASPNRLLADSPHGNMTGEAGEHSHATLEIPPGQPVPSVDLIVHSDPKKGWNLETKVSNFKFAPEHTSTASIPGEGHAHLYVNGKKITRIYGSWYYLENLNPGRNEITVALNANSHEALVHNGKKIEDTEIIQVAASNPQGHSSPHNSHRQ